MYPCWFVCFSFLVDSVVDVVVVLVVVFVHLLCLASFHILTHHNNHHSGYKKRAHYIEKNIITM